MANTTAKSQNNIDVYNKNKILEMKAVYKYLHSVFGTATASTTAANKKTATAKKPTKAASATTKADAIEAAQVQ